MTLQPLMLALCYFVLILVVFPIFCSDKVYSLFYQGDNLMNEKYEKIKTEHRKRWALDYLGKLDPQESSEYHASKFSEFIDNLIVVIAKYPSRKDDLVLSQLVTEIDRNIKSERFYSNAMIICNASRVAFEELESLSRFYPVRQAKNTTSWRLFNKEEIIKHDFIDCISMGVNHTEAKYITLIRDKILPYGGFLESLNSVIASQVSSSFRRGELFMRETSWLVLHLHEPVPFRHYGLTLNSVKELILIACFGSATFYLVFRRLEGKQPSLSFPAYSFIFFGALYFLTFAVIIGRPYISELRRTATALHRIYDPPEPVPFTAVSLPTTSVNELLLNLGSVHCSNYVPFHEVLDHMVNTLEKPSFVISPSLFRYVTST
ncbi:uncharacterized protein [Palaemon carinicauda]|uniref:uncharacterized protein n=1 Tax=Palaemon carinicauda TaxID=392227 RepID=UPI0035B692A7